MNSFLGRLRDKIEDAEEDAERSEREFNGEHNDNYVAGYNCGYAEALKELWESITGDKYERAQAAPERL
jgi:hypothetical protein